MKNYTTQTAALKATTIDTRLLDAKQIDTKKLFINDKDITEIVEKLNKKIELSYKLTGNHHLLIMFQAGVLIGAAWSFDTETMLTEQQISFQSGKITVFRQQCEIVIDSTQGSTVYFKHLVPITQNCMLGRISFDNFTDATTKSIMLPATIDGENNTVINLYQEGDNLTEIYDGAFSDSDNDKITILYIPFVYQSNDSEILDGELMTTYSLRQTQQPSTLLQKLIQKAQQNLDNPTE